MHIGHMFIWITAKRAKKTKLTLSLENSLCSEILALIINNQRVYQWRDSFFTRTTRFTIYQRVDIILSML